MAHSAEEDTALLLIGKSNKIIAINATRTMNKQHHTRLHYSDWYREQVFGYDYAALTLCRVRNTVVFIQ